MSRQPWEFGDEVWERFFDALDHCDEEMSPEMLQQALTEMGLDVAAGQQRVRRRLRHAVLQAAAGPRWLEECNARVMGVVADIRKQVQELFQKPSLAGGLQLQFRNLEQELTETDWKSLWVDARLLDKIAPQIERHGDLFEMLPDPVLDTAPDEDPSRAAGGAARALWERMHYESVDDLVLEDLGLALGVVIVDGGVTSSDARLVRGGQAAVIRCNAALDDPQRRRFAIAHELGHWVLERTGEPLHRCADLAGQYSKGNAQEVAANQFAAELLMPRRLLATELRGEPLSFSVLERVADKYQTSLEATGRRLAELSEEAVAFVVSQQERILWWCPSQSFHERGWIRAGARVKPQTIAGGYFSTGQLSQEPVVMDARSWMVRTEGQFKLQEESRLLPRYDHVMTLLKVIA